MKSNERFHMQRPAVRWDGSKAMQTACAPGINLSGGYFRGKLTANADEVTCPACKRAMEAKS